MSDCRHEWVEKYNRGHYSWHCQRCMRCLDIGGMLHSLTTAERELAEARAALMTDTLPMPAEDYPIARRLREERDHYRGLVDASDTTRREWEVRAATSYRDGRAAGLREGFDIARDHAWISTHDGWNHTAPCIDWEHAEKRLALALAQPAAETVRTETIFGCRTCPASTPGWTDGRFASPGWGRIDHIDGPNAICPVCAADPTSLDCLREEYPDVTPVAEPRDEGEVSDE